MSAPRGVAFCQAPCRRFAVSGGRSVASRPALPYRPRSQALQSRWYCTVSVWESRSLPEFFPDAPPRECPRRGASLFVRLPVGRFAVSGGRSVASRPALPYRPRSQALQSRWYCTVSVWESRSLPEFSPDAPPRLHTRCGASLFGSCFLSALCCLRCRSAEGDTICEVMPTLQRPWSSPGTTTLARSPTNSQTPLASAEQLASTDCKQLGIHATKPRAASDIQSYAVLKEKDDGETDMAQNAE